MDKPSNSISEEDATKVLKIMLEADDGCPHCASSLFYDFIREFPEFKDLAHRLYKEEFDYELED